MSNLSLNDRPANALTIDQRPSKDIGNFVTISVEQMLIEIRQ